MTQQPNNSMSSGMTAGTAILLLVAVALLMFSSFRGCGLPGWEISLPIGKVRVHRHRARAHAAGDALPDLRLLVLPGLSAVASHDPPRGSAEGLEARPAADG